MKLHRHSLTLFCDHPGCDTSAEFRNGTLAECRSDARGKGWKLGANDRDNDRCPEHGRRRRPMDFEVRSELAERRRKKRGIPSTKELAIAQAQAAVDAFNAAHPVGTSVRYWPWTREGEGILSRTRSAAQRIGGSEGTSASVWVEGHASCISLSHVEACR